MERKFKMTKSRLEETRKAAKEADENSMCDIEYGFIQGAQWADANPKDPNDIIIELIHQRSVAFDQVREEMEKVKIAKEALDKIGNAKNEGREASVFTLRDIARRYLAQLTEGEKE